MCFFQNADDDTKATVFSHEWTDYPSSLFETNNQIEQGFSMRKVSKVEFLGSLVSELHEDFTYQSLLPNSPLPTVFLVDAMAFIQRYQQLGASTFIELRNKYVQKILQLAPNGCIYIHIVGDRYDFQPFKEVTERR